MQNVHIIREALSPSNFRRRIRIIRRRTTSDVFIIGVAVNNCRILVRIYVRFTSSATGIEHITLCPFGLPRVHVPIRPTVERVVTYYIRGHNAHKR